MAIDLALRYLGLGRAGLVTAGRSTESARHRPRTGSVLTSSVGIMEDRRSWVY
ncbi:hypothetical protein [Streptomyces sp. IBSBF 3136]|uniref:hypothetical protein n=1 Tax=Streptomyces sp. IBSBF 3136 TaxID=2903524 RepID=UPI002FDBF8B7